MVDFCQLVDFYVVMTQEIWRHCYYNKIQIFNYLVICYTWFVIHRNACNIWSWNYFSSTKIATRSIWTTPYKGMLILFEPPSGDLKSKKFYFNTMGLGSMISARLEMSKKWVFGIWFSYQATLVGGLMKSFHVTAQGCLLHKK